ASNCPRRDGFIGLAPVAGCDLLRAGVENAGVADSGRLDRALDEGALAPHRLDQIDPRIGQGDGENQPWKPSPRANISDPSSFTQASNLKPGEAIRHMSPPSPLQISHGTDRGPLPRQKLQDKRDRRSLFPVEETVRQG